ncbi:hypothetical protein LTR86_007271 [Recurvomyces mirabilis]|nr:hypothetical protein LTR86_007271 [Recurvomyces mirabilis]
MPNMQEGHALSDEACLPFPHALDDQTLYSGVDPQYLRTPKVAVSRGHMSTNSAAVDTAPSATVIDTLDMARSSDTFRTSGTGDPYHISGPKKKRETVWIPIYSNQLMPRGTPHTSRTNTPQHSTTNLPHEQAASRSSQKLPQHVHIASSDGGSRMYNDPRAVADTKAEYASRHNPKKLAQKRAGRPTVQETAPSSPSYVRRNGSPHTINEPEWINGKPQQSDDN